MIKNILFDMGGVVFLQDTDEAFRRFREAGLDPEQYMGAFGQRDFFLDVESGKIGTNEFCLRMAQALDREKVSWHEAQQCWLGFVKGVPTDRLHELEKLKERYTLGLLSNTNPFIMAFTNSPDFSEDGKPISDYFHYLFLSYEMGVCKPSPEIFERAIEIGGMEPEETLFVDDSPTNIEAAKRLGFATLYVPTNEPWAPLLEEYLQKNQ
ncbi:MAG: HAD family phosphatase [Bacteroidales bacterium]|nr:HAD family phosphatase [Bacteroidales bacterium]